MAIWIFLGTAFLFVLFVMLGYGLADLEERVKKLERDVHPRRDS